MTGYREWVPGEVLNEHEFLLKIDGTTGFMTKLTKKNELPKAFADWGRYPYSPQFDKILTIYVFLEIPRQGWKIESWRIGKSQEWATMMHPSGFTLEIYLTNFLDIMKATTIVNGELQGFYSWKDHKLTKH